MDMTIKDKLEIMLSKQKKFTELFYKDKYGKTLDKLSKRELIEISRDLILQGIIEFTEVLNEIKGWKGHRPAAQEIDIDKLREELIDVLKFHFNILIIFGISADQIFMEFLKKSDIVEERYSKEKSKLR